MSAPLLCSAESVVLSALAAPLPVAPVSCQTDTPPMLLLPAANSAVMLLRPAPDGAAAAAELPFDDTKGELPLVLLPLALLPFGLLGGPAPLPVLRVAAACCAVTRGGSWASAQSAGICGRGGGINALPGHLWQLAAGSRSRCADLCRVQHRRPTQDRDCNPTGLCSKSSMYIGNEGTCSAASGDQALSLQGCPWRTAMRLMDPPGALRPHALGTWASSSVTVDIREALLHGRTRGIASF